MVPDLSIFVLGLESNSCSSSCEFQPENGSSISSILSPRLFLSSSVDATPFSFFFSSLGSRSGVYTAHCLTIILNRWYIAGRFNFSLLFMWDSEIALDLDTNV